MFKSKPKVRSEGQVFKCGLADKVKRESIVAFFIHPFDVTSEHFFRAPVKMNEENQLIKTLLGSPIKFAVISHQCLLCGVLLGHNSVQFVFVASFGSSCNTCSRTIVCSRAV